MRTKKAAKILIDAALAQVNLTTKRKYMIGSLSGGERQRLLFAQALIPEPSLLVLDEPMTSLDESGARLFETLITELNAKGTTVLWINHDLDQVQRLADSITVIDKVVIAHGATKETLTPAMQRGVFTKIKGEAA
jgi:zinc transport system ATP-binding protein